MQHEAHPGLPDYGEVSSRERALEQYAQDLHRREIQLMRDRIHKKPVGGGPTLGNAPGRRAAGAERVQAARAAAFEGDADGLLLSGGAASPRARETTFGRTAREVTAPVARPEPLSPAEIRDADDRATRRRTRGGWSSRAATDRARPAYVDDPRWRGEAATPTPRPRPRTAGAGERRRQLREAHASLETLMSDYGLGAAARSPEVLRRPRTASVVDRRRRAAPRADERAATLAGEVERLFKGEPSVSVPSAVAPPQYGATRRRWFQEVPPTEWFRHHHLIDPWVRYHTEGFPTPPPEPEPAPPPRRKKKKKAKKKRAPSPPPPVAKTPKKKKKKVVKKKATPPPSPVPSPRPATPKPVLRHSSAQTPPPERPRAPEAAPPPFDAVAARRARDARRRREQKARVVLQAGGRGLLARRGSARTRTRA